MNPVRAILLGVAAYCAFLVATVPAAAVAGYLASTTRDQATLLNVAGTVWNGSARMAIAARGFSLAVDEVRWKFLPSRLLAGRAAFDIEARTGGMQAKLEAARSPLAWQIRDLRANGDVAALAGLFPLAATWQPSGVMAIEAPFLEWDGKRASGNATAEWRDAVLVLSEARPLGSWRAQASAEGTTAKFTLATIKGPLRLSGSGTRVTPGPIAFSGEARAEPGRERELEAVLKLLGPRRADGTHAIEWR